MRILFVTSTRIGDAILSTGLLNRLIAMHRGAAITVACGPVAAPLFEGVPGLERVIALKKKRFNGHWLDFIGETITQYWDVVVDLRGSLATLVLMRGKRYAYHTNRAPVARVVQLSKFLGLDDVAAPKLWPLMSHEEEAKHLVPDGTPVLALGPTANWRGKEWAIENFIDLTHRLTASDAPLAGARVMVLGAPGERETAAPLMVDIKDRGGDVIEVFDGVSLLSAYACIARSALYIGNDSGLMHMAAAAQTPTLGLFGPTRDDLYAPFGSHCAVVRTPQSFDELFTSDLDVKNTGSLMGGLGVDAVERAALELIEKTKGAA
ncbi:MAG: glycosyltransferase family 9 protein [Alphaproteobacteria bacterium]|jgi:heptosyltransferase-3